VQPARPPDPNESGEGVKGETMRLNKAIKYPSLTPTFAQKLERRRVIYLSKYRQVNDLLEKPSKVETIMIENPFTKVLYKLFGWLVIKDQTK